MKRAQRRKQRQARAHAKGALRRKRQLATITCSLLDHKEVLAGCSVCERSRGWRTVNVVFDVNGVPVKWTAIA